MREQLIADYDRRTYCLQQFADKINQVNKAATNFNAAAVNSKFFAPWISTVLVGIYIIFGGFRVIEDPEKELAAFLATISIFRSIGGQFEQAYVETLKITSAYASICEITVFINVSARNEPQFLSCNPFYFWLSNQLFKATHFGLAGDLYLSSTISCPVLLFSSIPLIGWCVYSVCACAAAAMGRRVCVAPTSSKKSTCRSGA